jgi:exopolysaccharide biosynthesis protein
VTLEELAAILSRLGASDAVNFDGGGSSTMVLDEGAGPRVMNSTIHSGVAGRERPSATHLGVRIR